MSITPNDGVICVINTANRQEKENRISSKPPTNVRASNHISLESPTNVRASIHISLELPTNVRASIHLSLELSTNVRVSIHISLEPSTNVIVSIHVSLKLSTNVRASIHMSLRLPTNVRASNHIFAVFGDFRFIKKARNSTSANPRRLKVSPSPKRETKSYNNLPSLSEVNRQTTFDWPRHCW
jgi:hypothetical protein